jgi:hypothetical protein
MPSSLSYGCQEGVEVCAGDAEGMPPRALDGEMRNVFSRGRFLQPGVNPSPNGLLADARDDGSLGNG